MNKNKIIFIAVLAVLAVFFAVTTFLGWGHKEKEETLPPGTHKVAVADVIQTTNYTYLLVEEKGQEFWIAIVKRDSKKGDILYYTQAFEMNNFVSKELNRTFPKVLFVQDPADQLAATPQGVPGAQAEMPARKGDQSRQEGIAVTPPKGAITIGELYKNKEQYSGKSVTIRGKVVKFNYKIMNLNWVHIQDGTDFSGKFDLTVTTSDSLAVGNTATFTGTIALDRDFSAGYRYDVIMEQTRISDIRQ